MKRLIISLIAVIGVFLGSTIAAEAASVFLPQQGGTGTSSPSGILYGTNSGTNPLQTVSLGANCTFSGGVLNCTSSGAGSGTISTSTPAVVPNLLYFSGPSTVANVGTTTRTFSGPFTITGTSGYLVGGTNTTVNWTGLSTTTQPTAGQVLFSTGGAGVAGSATTTVTCGTNTSCTPFTILGSTPITITATGGSGGSGTVSTSSSETSGDIPFWTSTNGTPATLSGGLLSFIFSSALARLTVTNASTTAFSSGNIWIPSLGTAAGSIIAVDPSGKFIATTTSSGGVASVTGTYPIVSTGGTNPAISLAVATSSFTPSGEFSTTGTLGALLGGTNSTLALATNGVALTKLAQIAANSILGNNTGATANVIAFATSTLGIALGDTTGTLPINRGGTGQVTKTAGFDALSPMTTTGDLVVGGLSGTGIRVPIGTAGFVLASVNGTVGWVATSSINNGVSSIQQLGGGTAQTGAITFSTTTDAFNGLNFNENITNTGGAFTFANGVSGTLQVGGGGTGLSSLASGHLTYGSGGTALTDLSPGTAGQVLGIVGGVPAWVATSSASGSGTVGTGLQGQFPFYNANGTTLTATSTITLAQNKTLSFNSDFIHMGTSTCNLGLVGNGSSGAEICGNTNTPGGLILQVENDSSSPSAFDGLNFDNDQSTSALTFGGVFFNSSTYNFTGYGTGLAVPSNLSLENTQGSVSILAASTTAGGAYINFFNGGAGVNNETGRIIANGNFGLGSTSPSAHLSIDSASSTPTEALFRIANNGATVVNVATTTPTALASGDIKGFGIGTSSPDATFSLIAASSTANAAPIFDIWGIINGVTYLFQRIDSWGHLIFSGPPPVISSCGTTPTVVGNDNAFEITAGSVSATGCTATFAHPWPNAPVCEVSNQSMSVVNALTYTISTTAITISETGLTGDKVDVTCTGWQ